MKEALDKRYKLERLIKKLNEELYFHKQKHPEVFWSKKDSELYNKLVKEYNERR